MSVELAPHCWNATSFADPEYVMDFTSPRAFCALAMTAFASCAIAFPHRHAMPIAAQASFLTTVIPPYNGMRIVLGGPIERACRLVSSSLEPFRSHIPVRIRTEAAVLAHEHRRRFFVLLECPEKPVGRDVGVL